MDHSKAPGLLRSIAISNSVGKTVTAMPERRVPAVAGLKAALLFGELCRARRRMLCTSAAQAQTTAATETQAPAARRFLRSRSPRPKPNAAPAHQQRTDRGASGTGRRPRRGGQAASGAKGGLCAIAGRPHRHGRRLCQQHVGGDEKQYATDRHSAVARCHHQGFHPGSAAARPHRCHPLRSGRRHPSGRGNRDELVIRGVDSSANFFVSADSATTSGISAISTMRKALEVLKGPSALVAEAVAPAAARCSTSPDAQGSRRHSTL